MSIREFLGLAKSHETTSAAQASSADTDTVRKIISSLESMDPERARFMAAFAFILCRVARADLKISSGEIAIMEREVMERGNLPEAQAILIVQMAKTESILFGGTEDFLVTREFNKIATREEKMALLDCLFAVASDEMISTVEDNEISRICAELQIEHDEFIAVRMKFRDKRSVLQKPTQPPQ